MLERSKLISTKPDRAGRPSIRAVHTFEVPILVDGEKLSAKLIVRETNAGIRFYDHEMSSIIA
jgi:hypothetical protein